MIGRVYCGSKTPTPRSRRRRGARSASRRRSGTSVAVALADQRADVESGERTGCGASTFAQRLAASRVFSDRNCSSGGANHDALEDWCRNVYQANSIAKQRILPELAAVRPQQERRKTGQLLSLLIRVKRLRPRSGHRTLFCSGEREAVNRDFSLGGART